MDGYPYRGDFGGWCSGLDKIVYYNTHMTQSGRLGGIRRPSWPLDATIWWCEGRGRVVGQLRVRLRAIIVKSAAGGGFL